MTDTYQSWMQRVLGGREAKPLAGGETVKSSAGQPFGAVAFVKVQKKHFLAEVGKKGDDFIFHFFPTDEILNGYAAQFHYPMEEAFIKVFKDGSRIQEEFVEEMRACAVKACGFVNSVWGEEQALRVIDVIEENIEAYLAQWDDNGMKRPPQEKA